MSRVQWFVLLIAVVVAPLGIAQDGKDADKKAPIAPAEKLGEGWDEIDERLIFLMVRLANTESSLEAVEKVIGASLRKASARISESKRAVGENEKMDRKGGGPMKWSQFYGTTAEKFFYHPTDRNSSYHTVTVLSPQPPQNDNQTGLGVPSRQGLPVHQRPPQFDYIYRANQGAASKAESEAAGLRGKVEALTARRRNLELEQVALWVEIAFRAAAHFELNRKPVFRFEPVLPAGDPDARVHSDIMKTSAEFMRVALAIVEEAPKDQDGTLIRIKPAIGDAREKLDDAWLRLAVDTSDKNTVEGRFFALSKRLNDVSRNLTESYEISIDGDINADEVRKDTFRGQLQDSLISYAQIVLALDEMATQMKDQWNVKPDLDKPYATVSLSSIKPVPMSRVQDAGRSINSTPEGDSGQVSLFDGKSLNGWHSDSAQWSVRNGAIVGEKTTSNEPGSFLTSDRRFKDFELQLDFRLLEGNSGVQIRSIEGTNGMVFGPQADIAFEPDYKWLGCLTGERIQPGMISATSDEVKSRLRQAIKQNGWNSMSVSVMGNQAVISINDVTTVDANLPDGHEQGVIALQLHGGGRTRIEFRAIKVEER